MSDAQLFQNLRLNCGFVITDIEYVPEPLLDPMGRTAFARTQILERAFLLTIFSGLDDKEKSITLYHEILEAIAVSVEEAPEEIQDFNEGDFERVAYEMHERLGTASPVNLNTMLQIYGFSEE